MRFIKQLLIILGVTFAGEALHFLLPLPVPASIYGLVLMLLCLRFKVFPLRAVEETGDFLIDLMPPQPWASWPPGMCCSRCCCR